MIGQKGTKNIRFTVICKLNTRLIYSKCHKSSHNIRTKIEPFIKIMTSGPLTKLLKNFKFF